MKLRHIVSLIFLIYFRFVKKQDKKRILKKIRRDEYLELSKVADLKEKIYTNKKKYSRKKKHKSDK